jgi:acetyl esterase/lipase
MLHNRSAVSRAAVTILGLVAIVSAATAQQPTFVYPSPLPGTITVVKDVPYATTPDGVTLQMDVYRPAKTPARAPVLIFFNQSVGAQRTAFTFYVRWGEMAASRGLVGLVPDLRRSNAAQDFQLLLSHLAERAADYGIDPDAIAVYAGSGNVVAALPTVEDPKQTAVKAAVMYYGAANVNTFRRDLPVLFVRAGLDRPPVNAEITIMVAAAVAQNAPVTMLNHPTGHHGFEEIDNDQATRDVIDQTIAFVKRATSASYQSALRAGLSEATAAAHVAQGRFREAVAAYAPLVKLRPEDNRLRLSYAEALLGAGEFSTACDEFETLTGKRLGPRDLGLPAARACVQGGDADRAIAWLQSIPQRFLPLDVQKEAVFAPLQGRADFQAIFKR